MLKKFALLSFSALTAAVVMTGSSKPAAACGTEAYIGQICIMAGTYCPYNTVDVQGQTLAINTYQALYSLVGVTYGGDARTTFGVPDFRGRTPSGWGAGPGLTAHAVSYKYGQEGVTQTLAMLANHNHGATFIPQGSTSAYGTTTVNVPAVTGSLAVNSTPNLTATGTANVTLNSDTKAMIGATTATSKSNTPAQKSTLTVPGSLTATIYGTAGSTNDVEIGPDGSIKGTATGTVNSTVSGTITNTVTGSAPLPAFTIQVPLTTGGVNVAASGGSQPIPTQSPSIAMRYCMVTEGIYPQRP